MGGWQSHQRGHSLSKSVRPGQKVRFVCADTSRARQTADQIYCGMQDGLQQWGREADVGAPEPIPELRNFQVWTPDGPRDVTSAFRQYQALMEKLERMAVGDRPRWLVEIDRFYRNQLGGADPIYMWLTIPLMYFEPPQSCVRRFWRGFHRLMAESPDTRIIAATHSGPIRAFATWAHGYDPGEPYNTEEVVVRIRRGGGTALVAYRNRVTEVNVPPPDEMPVWD
jgi:broad specificity phosphatase PhoE